MFCFIFKTFYYENYQKIPTVEKYCNELLYHIAANYLHVAHSFTHTPTPSPYIQPQIILKQSPEGHPISLSTLYQESSPMASLKWAIGLLKSQPLGGSWVRSGQPEAPRHFIP